MTEATGWDAVGDRFPSWRFDGEEWLTVFDERPEALTSLLGAVYRAGTVADQRRAGTFAGQNGGRRVSGMNGNMDELWRLVSPRYSMDPFPVALRELMGDIPLRRFAGQVPMHHQDLSKLLNGKKPLNLSWLEKIALAGGVAPAFFLEWRILKTCQIVEVAFTQRPNLSVTAIKMLERV